MNEREYAAILAAALGRGTGRGGVATVKPRAPLGRKERRAAESGKVPVGDLAVGAGVVLGPDSGDHRAASPAGGALGAALASRDHAPQTSSLPQEEARWGERKHSSAILDVTRTYRYRLDRHLHDFGNGGKMLFVMLNPSTADEEQDDPTIRRCKAFAWRHACTDLIVCNLYAYRATSPKTLRVVSDPIGPENEAHLRAAAREASIIVAAWGGNHLGGAWTWRVVDLLREYQPVHILRLTASGDPGHPLYIPAETPLIEWFGRKATMERAA